VGTFASRGRQYDAASWCTARGDWIVPWSERIHVVCKQYPDLVIATVVRGFRWAQGLVEDDRVSGRWWGEQQPPAVYYTGDHEAAARSTREKFRNGDMQHVEYREVASGLDEP